MKKLCIALFALAALLQAQTFTFIPSRLSNSGNLGGDIGFPIVLKNISTQPITISLLRTENDLPNDWVSSLCFDQNCFAPFIDSVATTADFGSSPLAPGDSRDVSIHVFPFARNGSASVTVVAKNNANPAERVTLTFTATAPMTDAEDATAAVQEYRLHHAFPNPFNPATTVRFSLPYAGHIRLALYSVYGTEVSVQAEGYYPAGEHLAAIDAGKAGLLSSGVYFLRLQAGNRILTQKLILEK